MEAEAGGASARASWLGRSWLGGAARLALGGERASGGGSATARGEEWSWERRRKARERGFNPGNCGGATEAGRRAVDQGRRGPRWRGLGLLSKGEQGDGGGPARLSRVEDG